jgi:gluconolactonase
MRLRRSWAPFALGLAFTINAQAGAPGNIQQASPIPLAADGQALATHVVSLDPFLNHILSADAKVIVAKGENYFGVIEGSAWVSEGTSGYLLFTDFAANVIYKWEPKARQLSVYLDKSGYTGSLVDIAHEGRMTTTQYGAALYIYDIGANGIALDPQGRVLLCAQGDRQVVRLEPDGVRTVVAAGFQGHRFNHTNSMAIKSDGTIYMADSAAGVHVPHPPSADVRDALPLSVYMIKDGAVSVAIADHGHGLAFSPDESILYVGIGNSIMRYDVRSDDSVANRRVFIDMSQDKGHGGPNQIAIDREGNVFSAGPGGLWIMNSSGKHIGTIPLPALAAGLAFGGPDLKTLYILASRNLFQVRVKVPGMLLPARLRMSGQHAASAVSIR